MGGTLVFEIGDDLKRIVEHTREHGECRVAYQDKVGEPSLFFVKDQGVYLMSASKVRLLKDDDDEDGGNLVVYAEGMDPKKDDFDAWYDDARRICGGDDFGENVSLEFFEDAIKRGCTKVKIKLTETKMSMIATMR